LNERAAAVARHARIEIVYDNPMSPHDFAKYPRDLAGYGRDPPDPRWPGGARVAVQFVVNYEEGGERNILHGRRRSCLTCSARSRGRGSGT